MPKPTTPNERHRLQLSGLASIVDVAVAVFADARVAPLLADLNPTLSATKVLPAGTVVEMPARAEAQAFARRMGFTLGFDERAGNGTHKRRAWAQMQGSQTLSCKPCDAALSAQHMLENGTPPVDVARRLIRLCLPADLETFLSRPVGDPRLLPVQQALELQSSFPRARARLSQASALVEATRRPGGLQAILAAAAEHPAAASAVLSCTLVPEGDRRALVDAAPRVTKLVARAERIAKMDRFARASALRGETDGIVVAALVDAFVDGVAPLTGERLALLGIDRIWAAIAGHLERLQGLLKTQRESLSRAGVDVVRTLARDEPGHRLPRPWPLVAAVTRGLGPLADAVGPAAIDDGVGGLLAQSSPAPPAQGDQGVPTFSAQHLACRAVHAARTADVAADLAERLAPRVITLLQSIRPLLGEHGGLAVRRNRRRAHYEAAMFDKTPPDANDVAAYVDDIVDGGRRLAIADVKQLTPAQAATARQIARAMAPSISVQQRRGSALAHAVLVVALAVEPAVAGLLARPSGCEAFVKLLARHGGKVLAHSCAAFVAAADARG
jgi:hypothetical protein